MDDAQAKTNDSAVSDGKGLTMDNEHESGEVNAEITALRAEVTDLTKEAGLVDILTTLYDMGADCDDCPAAKFCEASCKIDEQCKDIILKYAKHVQRQTTGG